MTKLLLMFLLLAGLLSACDGADPKPAADGAADPADGRRMYRDGLLPSGESLTAIVAGDVPILGTQFSCQSCHGRSGMGAAEGAYVVPPIAGQFLFAPSPQPKRPAYTEESLARLLRDGVTPDGRLLGELMPLYKLTDDEVAAMTAYLARLSFGISPGVDDKVIRFATVVTEDVDAGERAAVLDVLNTFVREKNSNTRLESERWDRGYTPYSRLATVHRDWVLEEWTLTGPPESWDKQLEQRYRDTPVFALLSGLSNDSWGPVGRFCERNEIPCLFPGTRMTDAAEGDFYTLYYSRGLELEADLIADHLAKQPVSDVIQVFCGVAPAQAASGLRASLQEQELTVSELAFDCDDALPVAELIERSESTPDAAIVLWLGQEHIAGIEGGLPPSRVYFSSTLLGDKPDSTTLSVPGAAFMAHPFLLPGQFDPAMARFKAWAKSRGIEMTAPRRQSEAFFACLVVKDAVKHIGRFFIREFMLDMLDHAQSLVAYLPYYPRPTLGPGQRFVNKGGYVLPIVDGQLHTDDAAWILP
jgi:mono/diheme cytochrome c family protein